MKYYFQTWRGILILTAYLHIFIFIGVFLAGILQLIRPIIFADYLFSALYLVISAVAIMIFVSDLSLLQRKELSPKRLQRWESIIPNIIITSIIFIILWIFRLELNSLFLFLGYEIGRFFIRVATYAFESTFSFDLDDIKFYLVAWVFQWHFIFAVVGLAQAVGKKSFLFLKKLL